MIFKKASKYVSTALSILVLLPGCAFFDKKSDKKDFLDKDSSGKVLIYEDGRPVLTEAELDNFLEQAVEADPQAKMMLSMMPEALKEQALEAKKRASIISAWAKHEGVRNSAEYKQKRDLIMCSVDESLDNEAFMKKHKAEVTDKEAKDFYEENKLKDPRFQISAAGTKAFGVEFDSKAKANEFLEKIKSNVSGIEKAAKGLKIRDFGLVNKESYVAKAIKDAILSAKNLSAQVVEDDNKYFVVAVLGKETAKYHSFEDLKDGIKRMLEGQKIEDTLSKELPKYENKFNIKINEDYAQDMKSKKEARENELRAQFEAQSQAPQGPDNKNKNEKIAKELAQAQPKVSGAA